MLDFIKRLQIHFSSKHIEEEYRKVQKVHTRNFFKVLLLKFGLTCALLTIYSLAERDYKVIGPFVGVMIACILIWKFSHKLRDHKEPLVFGFGLAFTVGAFFYVREDLVTSQYFPALMIGYTIGIFEKMLTLRLSNFTFKIAFSIILLISKIVLFPVSALAQTFSLIIQSMIIASSLIADLLKAKEDRKTFKRFHDYREGHTKFRNLIISGLPTSLLILSRDLKQKMFANKYLETKVKLGRASEDCSIQIPMIHEWLDSLKIDKKSLLKEATKTSVSISELPLTVLELLKAFNNKDEIVPECKVKFNAEFSHEPTKTRRIYEINVFPIIWDTQESVTIILNDVSMHSLNQSLKIADSNKDKMLAMISHELRTPLNGILGVVKILERQTKDQQTLQYLSIMKSSGELLYNLVNSILDLQQIRDKKFTLKMTKHDLHELLQDVHNLFIFQFEEKNLSLSLEIDKSVPKYIVNDQNRLRQVLINLIGNALKFTFEGGVSVSAYMDSERKGYINFSVADTGIGVKEEDKPKLFKMYGRLDQADLKTNTQGVGFGLEISNQLAQMLADNTSQCGITFVSQVGKGTTFSFAIKDSSFIGNDNSSEIDYFEPQAFAEDIENLSLKMCPYSLYSGASSEREINNLKPITPPSLSMKKAHSHLLPICSVRVTRTDTRAQTHTRNSITPFRPKSRYNSSTNFLKVEAQSSITQNKEGTTAETGFLPSPLSIKNSTTHYKYDKEQSPKNVLIIDDNPFNLLVAKHLVEGLGFLVKTALNGQLGVELVKSMSPINKRPFDVILMDLQMPVMDGYEATRVLKTMMESQEISDIPIIALSANDSEDDKARCREVGMQDHLSKPLKEDQFKKILGEVAELDISLGSLCEVEVD